METVVAKGKLGILVGGGPAPGLNGVISSVTIEARRNGLEVFGIMDGFKWLVRGNEADLLARMKELRIRDVSRIHFDGGSILHTSRTNPLKVENGVDNAVRLLLSQGFEYMVTIGGDDTAFGACEIARKTDGKIKFAHVPKTIDNDLPLPNNISTFGYQTARDLGAVLVKNLMEDSRTTDRWYIVEAMGRHTGHLALGIAKSAAATLAIIPEEFGLKGTISLTNVCDILETSILKRRAMGNWHGVLVIAEGIVERLGHDELKKIPDLVLEYDPFGHLLLADIELGKVIKREIENRFARRGEKMRLVDLNIGYVLRCADPIPFDQEYTRDLGFHAVRYLMSKKKEHQTSAMIVVVNGRLTPMPFEEILDPETHKTRIRFVDIESDSYKIARTYMVRLEPRDFEDKELLSLMAKEAKITEEEFVKKFKYLVN